MATLQTTFRAALLDPSQPVPDGLVDGSGTPTEKRFAVYRNNVIVALIDALRTAFPVLVKLLGQENFDQIARLFARTHPPTSPLMMHYGAELPAFLRDFAPLAHIPYLPDIARLELALRRSYHAADGTAMDPAALGAVDPERLMQYKLTLAPAVQLVASNWPIHAIWTFNMVADAPKPPPLAQPTLVTRPEFDPDPHPLTPAEAAWIDAIAGHKTIGAAQDAAFAVDPEFDLSRLLTLLIQQGALTGLNHPKD